LALNAVKPNIIRPHALGFGLRPDGYQHQSTKPLRRKRRGIKPEEMKIALKIKIPPFGRNDYACYAIE